jgi:KDO2-lipid IV(A) lauroyltransferase
MADLRHRRLGVVVTIEPPELFEWFAELRRHVGLTVVPHGPAAGHAVLGALKRNELVGLVCDRDLARTGIEVEFFGEGTTLPGGPATLALRTGAPIVPTAIYFDGPSSRHAVLLPALDTTRHGKLRDDVQRVTQDLATALEVLIRKAPEQWHLLQPNWPSDHTA